MPPLDASQVAAFFERGFTVQTGVFEHHEIVAMDAAFERLERHADNLTASGLHHGAQFVLGHSEAYPAAIQRIVWCGAAEPLLADYGRDRRLVEMAAQLLGSRHMEQLINQAHFKRPGDGVEFPWHQDSTHRRFGGGEWHDLNGRGSYVQTVTAIDPMTEGNGPLRLIPGSCRLGHLTTSTDGSLPRNRFDVGSAISAELAPGSVLLFGPYTVHGSDANRSPEPRRTFLNGFAYPGANSRVYPGAGAGRRLRVH